MTTTEETPKHGTLVEALLAFHAEAPDLHKDKDNGAFRGVKYLSLDSLTDTVRPLLTKHGLVWMTMPDSIDGAPALAYRLMHKTGEVINGVMPLMLSKQDAQGQGSAITYARRYALMAVLNLVADEDDDGNAAGSRGSSNGHHSEPEPQLLSDESVSEVLTAISNAKMGTEWVRGQLVAIGAPNVPQGALTKRTIQLLSPDQAVQMVQACDEAAEAKATPA